MSGYAMNQAQNIRAGDRRAVTHGQQGRKPVIGQSRTKLQALGTEAKKATPGGITVDSPGLQPAQENFSTPEESGAYPKTPGMLRLDTAG